jgi:radical SAM protein with 4Fe4S-binding SPASM domain
MIAFSEKMARSSCLNHRALTNAWIARAEGVAAELGVNASLPAPFADVDPAEVAAIDLTEPEICLHPLPHLAAMLMGGPVPGDEELATGNLERVDLDELAEAAARMGEEGRNDPQELASTGSATWKAVPELTGGRPARQTAEEARLQAQMLANVAPPTGFEPAEPRADEDSYACKFLWNELFVSLSGDVAPCCIEGRPVVGNIHEQDLATIWNGEMMQEMRSRMMEGDPIPCCRDCNYNTRIGRGSYREDTYFVERNREV